MRKFELNEREVELFKYLQGSQTVGDSLVSFLERFCDHICDVRNMPELSTETMRAHQAAGNAIQQEIIHRIRMGNGKPAATVDHSV